MRFIYCMLLMLAILLFYSVNAHLSFNAIKQSPSSQQKSLQKQPKTIKIHIIHLFNARKQICKSP